MSENKVSLKKRIYYCLPDAPLVFSSAMVSYYLLYFYTDVYLLPVHVVSAIFFACNIFDAVNDCCFAYIMCKVRSRHGIYRPYILWTALPLAVTSVLLFTTPDFSENGKIVYVILIYFLWNTIFTFFSVAREALLPVIGKTESERVTLNSLRIGFTILLMTVCSTYLLPMVNFLGAGDQKRGFFLTMLILSAVGLPLQLIAFWKNKEPENTERVTSISFWRVFAITFKDKCTAVIMLMFAFYWIGNTFRNQSIVYYLTYAVNKPEYITTFIFSSMGASFAMQFFFRRLVKIAKPSVLAAVGILGSAVSTLLIWVAGNSFAALISANVLYGIFSALPSNLIFIILAKRVDYLSEKHKLSFSGLLYSVMTFFKKVGVGIGGALLAWVLALVQYTPNVAQSEAAVFGITFNFIWGTIAGLLLAGIFMLFYLKFERKEDAAEIG